MSRLDLIMDPSMTLLGTAICGARRADSDEVSRRERQTLRGLEIHWAGLTNERPPVLGYLTSLYRTTSLSPTTCM